MTPFAKHITILGSRMRAWDASRNRTNNSKLQTVWSTRKQKVKEQFSRVSTPQQLEHRKSNQNSSLVCRVAAFKGHMRPPTRPVYGGKLQIRVAGLAVIGMEDDDVGILIFPHAD